jgi:hypothetical protein
MKHLTFSGMAMIVGGVSFLIANVVITPMMNFDAPFAEMVASKAFLWRLSIATLTVFLLMVGSVGLYAYQSGRSGLFGKIAFGLTFLGCASMFAHEWAQVFYMHSLAVIAPDALEALSDAKGTIHSIEGPAAFATFVLGWVVFAVSMLVAKVFARLAPVLIIIGVIATPLLALVVSPILGGAIGSAVLGSGFILLGRELIKNPAGAK